MRQLGPACFGQEPDWLDEYLEAWLLLERDGGDVADFRVSALVVVEADELGESCGEFIEGGEGVPVVELVFQDRPERLGGGVVVA